MEELKREMKEERERRERETDREKGEWEWEKKELLGRIRRIGEDQDRAEREERRRNIVIKGVDWNEGSNEETVKEFINEKMRIGAEVEKAHMIKVGWGGGKNTIIVATMKSMEEKIRIMKEKSKWEKGVYMDDDLTKKRKGWEATHKKGSQRKNGTRRICKDRIQETNNREQMVQVERKRREAGGRKKERGRKMKKEEQEGGLQWG